jgi:hypothetical protein
VVFPTPPLPEVTTIISANANSPLEPSAADLTVGPAAEYHE